MAFSGILSAAIEVAVVLASESHLLPGKLVSR